MSSRVIRRTRVLPDAFPVSVPAETPRSLSTGKDSPPDDLTATRERERKLRKALADLKNEWKKREEEYAKELEEAVLRASEPAQDIVKRFSSVVDDFLAQRTEMLRSSEESLVRLAVAVARRIIGDTVVVNQDAVLDTVRRALKQVMEKESVIIRVNPEDLRTVREHGSEWLSLVEGTHSLDIIDDERISRGGCLVETEAGNVEAQIEKQIRTLERALVEKIR